MKKSLPKRANETILENSRLKKMHTRLSESYNETFIGTPGLKIDSGLIEITYSEGESEEDQQRVNFTTLTNTLERN